MASLAQTFPRTLTERGNDISTLELTPNLSELAPRIFSEEPGIVKMVVDGGGKKHRMKLSVPRVALPEWFVPSLRRCAPLLVLPFDWNRGGAPPVEAGAIQLAMDALWCFMADRSSIPQWTPTAAGGVQLDWHEKGIDLEIEFPPSAAEGYVVFSDNRDREADWDGPISRYQAQLQSIFKNRLVSDR